MRLDSLLATNGISNIQQMFNGTRTMMNIQFVNDSLGFIYGYSVQYGFINSVYRTTDGGVTWHIPAYRDGEKDRLLTGLGLRLQRSFFNMFDEKNGFVADVFSTSTHVSYFKYLITSDGGVTWQPRLFYFHTAPKAMNPSKTEIIYLENGRVRIDLITLPHYPDHKHEVRRTIYSDDYGKNFIAVSYPPQ